MEVGDERIRYAVEHTEILRLPKQSLATFGTTNVDYYLLTEPVYAELVTTEETVIRVGRVSSESPRIVTPFYLARLEGFTENARKYIEIMAREYPHTPGLLYSYRNEPRELTTVSERLEMVAGRLSEQIEKESNKLAAIIKGVDELWDVSLLKFIREMTERSLGDNLAELNTRGLLDMDRAGVPRDARYRIEALFDQANRGWVDPAVLKRELDRWDLFEEYEDRFLALFRKGK